MDLVSPTAPVARGEHDQAGVRTVRAVELAAVDDPRVAVVHGRDAGRLRVRPRLGLREGEGGEHLAGRAARHPPLALLLGSEVVDRAGAERRVRRHGDRGGAADAGQLLDHDGIGHVVEPGATDLLREGHAHEAQLGELRKGLVGKALLLVQRRRQRGHFGESEIADHGPDLEVLLPEEGARYRGGRSFDGRHGASPGGA